MNDPQIHKQNEIIIKVIIENLKNGVPPWRKPWNRNSDYVVMGAKKYSVNLWPRNIRTPKTLFNIDNGVSLMIAAGANGFMTNFWLNEPAIKELNIKLREGFDNPWLIQRRYFNHAVYNIEQVENYEKSLGLTHVRNSAATNIPVSHFKKSEILIQKLKMRAILKITEGANEAVYYPRKDFIHMPCCQQFIANSNDRQGEADYWATMWHEVVHWTGHERRLNRFQKSISVFGDKEYSFEELVAELGATFICSRLNINADIQSASYINVWLKGIIADEKPEGNRNNLLQNWTELLENRGITALEEAGKYANEAAVFILSGGKLPKKKMADTHR